MKNALTGFPPIWRTWRTWNGQGVFFISAFVSAFKFDRNLGKSGTLKEKIVNLQINQDE